MSVRLALPSGSSLERFMNSQQSSSPERMDNQLTTSEQLVERSFSQARLVCGASASTSFTGSGVLPCSIFTEISPLRRFFL